MIEGFLAVKNQLAEQVIGSISQSWGISLNVVAIILMTAIIWSTVWKLLALWKAANEGSVIWFIALAIFNTLGILSILYIYVFSKMDCCKREIIPTKIIAKKGPLAKPKKKIRAKKK